MKINALRKEYEQAQLRRNDLIINPFDQFNHWFNETLATSIIEPNAMVLATATPNGIPSCRTVLMKDFSERGVTFFTNYESRKGQQLEGNPNAAVTFLWKEIERQVLIEGRIEKTSREESETYFHQRPRRSQLSVWASKQSAAIKSRGDLEAAYAAAEKQFEGREVPLPDYWGGYLLIPARFEFWQGRADRLHDRFLYTLAGGGWNIQRLSP